MLGSISLAHAKSCVTLLLWALILGVAIARKVVVDDSETDKIIYSKGWAEFPGCLGCTRAPDLVQAHVNNGTWHSWDGLSDHYGDLDFSFTFYGTAIDVRVIVICPNSSWTPIWYYIDDARKMVPKVQNCSKPGYFYNQALFPVQRLSNGEHTLKVASTALLLFDYLVYETQEPIGTANSPSEEVTGTYGPRHTSTATNLSTSLNPMSSSLEMTQETGSPSSPNTNLAIIVGGVISGITVLAILGVLWHSKKRSRKSERTWPPPLSSELHPEPAPPVPKTMRAVSYDPPGYTEKNTYFGIQSLSANSSAGAKGPVPT